MDLPQFQVHAALEEKHWWFLGRRHIVTTLLKSLVPVGEHKPVIDVGCGTGGMTAFLTGSYNCIGVDPATDAIAFARQRFPQCTFIHGRVPHDVQERVAEADAVLLLEVLEHVEKDRDFVQDILGEMKPGAVFITMAPADPSMWGPHDAGFDHFRRYDEHAFRNLWAGARVKELLVSHCNTRLYPLAKLMRMLARLKGSSWGPGDTDLALPWGPLNSMLTAVFRGEAKRLLDALHGTGKRYRRGVSLLAVLRKE